MVISGDILASSILNFISLLFIIFSIPPTIKKYLNQPNKLDALVIAIGFFGSFKIITALIASLTELIWGQALIFDLQIYNSFHLSHLMSFGLAIGYIWFSNMMINLKRFYSVTVVFMIFAIIYLIETSDELLITIYSTIYYSIGIVIIGYVGIKYRNGTTIAIMIMGFSQIGIVFGDDFTLNYAIKGLFTAFVYFMGISGNIDVFINQDRQKTEIIKNTWISGRLFSKQQKQQLIPHQIVITCPVCSSEWNYKINQLLANRFMSSNKGLFTLKIKSEESKCTHKFLVYINRDWKIMGYD